MLTATVKGLLGHRARLALTLVAIVLGVAFVAGTFVFTDTLGNAFDDLFSGVYQGVDVEVSSTIDDELAFLQAGRLSASLLDEIRSIEGVAHAWGTVVGYAQFVAPDGSPVDAGGAPTFGFSWPDGPGGPFRLRAGRPPVAADEVAIDAATARRVGFGLGDTVEILLSGPTGTFTIVGITGFGNSASPGGATAAVFDTATAQELLAGEAVFDSISIVADVATTPDVLVEKIDPLLPAGTRAQTGSDAAAESAELIKDQLGVITTVILVFAGISLFVGGFIIQNTFRIIVAQRTRELALLRALGATRGQVTRMVLLEASLVGALGSALGVAAGVGLAFLLRSVFEAAGASFPSGATEVAGRTIVVGLVAGISVTVASALLPSRKAGSIPPVAALTMVHAAPTRRSLRVRGAAGGLLLAVGVALIALGLFGEVAILNNLQLVGIGAATGFIGVSVLGPVFASPLARAVAAPVHRILGIPGRLARDNAMRSPRRTAATASALMVGLTLVAGIFILASSLQRTFITVVDEGFSADFAIQQQTSGFPPLGISPTVADRLERLPELAVVTRIRGSVAKVAGEVTFVGGVEPTVTDVFRFGVADGSLSSLRGNTVAIRADDAQETGIAVGDQLTIEFAETGAQRFDVVALWEADVLQSAYLLSFEAFRANFVEDLDTAVYVKVAEGIDPADARRAIESVTDDFATATVFNTAEFRENAVAQLDQLLAIVFGLLALAIFISFWGITNTLALSVFERTREIGVLRAIGMTRAQVRGMVRWEAVIVSVLGALLGIVAGTALGWAIVRALADEGILFSLPVTRLGIVLVATALAGVIAAAYPTIRASRLNVLEAIAYE